MAEKPANPSSFYIYYIVYIHAKEGLYLTYMMHEGKHFMWNFTKYLASKRKEADWAMGHRRSITQSKEKLY
jgi:hypothetical protein